MAFRDSLLARTLNLREIVFAKHYENMPMQNTEIFSHVKNENFSGFFFIFFLFLLKT